MTSKYHVFKDLYWKQSVLSWKVGTPARESVAPTRPHWNHGSKMAIPNGSELTAAPRSHQGHESTQQGKMLTLPHSSYSESVLSSVLIFSIALEPCYVCVCVCVHALSHFSRVWLFVTPWTVAHQAALSMGFSKQEYWSGLPCSLPGDIPDLGIKLTAQSPALAGHYYHLRSPCDLYSQSFFFNSLILFYTAIY